MEQVGLGDIRLFSEIRWRFIKAYLQAKLARLLGFPQSPLDLDRVTQWMGLKGTRELGLATVNLNRVVGTQGNCIEFDRAFRPRMGGILQAEWEAAGADVLQSLKPPVLKLFQWGDAFFVLNGHDEALVSVLKALGQRTIRAYVIGPDKALAPPPTIKFLEQWEREVDRSARREAQTF
jgi:hypothetical protein